MLVANFGADELNAFTEHHFWLALRNETFTIEWQGEGPTCRAEGTLWGGNLAMLISLIGTPWMPKIENGILVLEDINEHPFPGRTYAVAALSCGNFATSEGDYSR